MAQMLWLRSEIRKRSSGPSWKAAFANAKPCSSAWEVFCARSLRIVAERLNASRRTSGVESFFSCFSQAFIEDTSSFFGFSCFAAVKKLVLLADL